LTIWLDIGDGGPWWWSFEELHEPIVEPGVSHEFHYFVGEHDDTYWSAHLGDYLVFHATALHGRGPLSVTDRQTACPSREAVREEV
jgi:hypothetical protein